MEDVCSCSVELEHRSHVLCCMHLSISLSFSISLFISLSLPLPISLPLPLSLPLPISLPLPLSLPLSPFQSLSLSYHCVVADGGEGEEDERADADIEDTTVERVTGIENEEMQ